jgi:hypothetical protein
MNRRWFIRMVVVLIVLLALPLVVEAQCGCPVIDEVDVVNIDYDCENLSVSWSHSSGTDSGIIIIEGSTFNLLAFQLFANPSDSYSMHFSPPLAPGDKLIIDIGIFDALDLIAETVVEVSGCVGVEVAEVSSPPCSDGRLTYFTCDQVAVYPRASEDGVGWAIYRLLRGSDAGQFALDIPETRFENLPDTVEANCTIDASDDGKVVVYLLTTGEIQINVGPDDEGKVFVFIFDDLNSAPNRLDTYMSGTTPDRLPSCT